MATPDSDVAILGAGCAGLSLAYRLRGSGLRVTLIDRRTAYEDDRAWSFWRTAPDPFASHVRARWSSWAVSAGGREARRSSRRLSYESLAAADFYTATLAAVDADPRMTLWRGTDVTSEPCRTATGWTVETTAGAHGCRVLVDTRPPTSTAPIYGQHFVGHEVAIDRAAFDPTTVRLMDFEAPRGDRVDFIYVLPFAPDRALIEATTFAPRPPEGGDLARVLARATEALCGGVTPTILRREAGWIPMSVSAPLRRSLGVSHGVLGIGGGSARPSTGYAFQRIQAAADHMAARILAGEDDIQAPPDTAATRWMDRLFLKVLMASPARAPDLFRTLFARAPADRLERFLSGSRAPLDRLSAIASMPPGPFLRGLVG